jgi:hypothetical protein
MNQQLVNVPILPQLQIALVIDTSFGTPPPNNNANKVTKKIISIWGSFLCVSYIKHNTRKRYRGNFVLSIHKSTVRERVR